LQDALHAREGYLRRACLDRLLRHPSTQLLSPPAVGGAIEAMIVIARAVGGGSAYWRASRPEPSRSSGHVP
jgi:hypothetical protein